MDSLYMHDVQASGSRKEEPETHLLALRAGMHSIAGCLTLE